MSTHSARIGRLVEAFGGARDGEFTPGGRPISQLAATFGTPFYLYHGDLIVDQLHRVQAALGETVELFYSVKANPSLGLCRLVASTGLAGAEVASEGELVLANAAGFAPGQTIFAGPGKTDRELAFAIRQRILAINVESLGEIARLALLARSTPAPVGIGLRLNPAKPLPGSQMRMGGGASQFGLDPAELAEAIRLVMSEESLALQGIHVYTATQVFEIEALVSHCQTILETACQVADLAGQPLAMVDLGGGFGIPYHAGMAEFDLAAFGRRLQPLLAGFRAHPRLRACRWIIELGRYLVAEAGIYVTRVIDVKHSWGKIFVITDGGMNHHAAATGNFGQVFRKPFPLANLSQLDSPVGPTVSLAGPCCTPLDSFGAELDLGQPAVGDLIGIFCSGAYGLNASKINFLSHPLPAELLLRQGRWHLLRPAGQPEDVLHGQLLPSIE